MGAVTIKTSNDDNNISPNPPEKPKRIWWRVLLAFIGGFLCFPLVLGGAALAGGALFTAGQIIEMGGGNSEDILGENYRNKTLTEILLGIGSIKVNTLGDLNEISPLIRKTLEEQLNPVLEQYLGTTLDWDAIKDRTLQPAGEGEEDNSIGSYFSTDFLGSVYLVNLIPGLNDDEGGEELLNIFNYFLYDVIRDENGDPIENEYGGVTIDKSNPYSILDFASGAEFFNDLIGYISIGDVMEIDASSPQILQSVQHWPLGKFSERIETLTIRDVLIGEGGSDNAIINALADYTLKDLREKDLTNELTIGDIYPAPTEGPDDRSAIIKALSDKKLSELNDSDVIMALKIGDIFDDLTEADFLYSYRNKTLSEMQTLDIYNEKLIDVLGETKINENRLLSAIYAKDPNATIGDLSNDELILSLTLQDVVETDDTSSILYILSHKVDPITGEPYSIDELGKAVDDLTFLELYPDPEPGEPDNRGNVLKALAHLEDENGNHYKIKDLNTAVNHLTLRDVVGDTDSPMLQSLMDKGYYEVGHEGDPDYWHYYTIEEMDQAVAQLQLQDVLSINSESPKILTVLAGEKLDDIPAKIKTLKLSDCIDIYEEDVWDEGHTQIIHPKSSPILLALQDVSVFNGDALATKLDGLKFNDVYEESDLGDGILKTLWDNTNGGNFLITEIATEVEKLPLVDIVGDSMYDKDGGGNFYTKTIDEKEYKRINKTWWFLFTELNETFTAEEKYYVLKEGATYKLDDMDKIVKNMEDHMKYETIRTLYEAEFIDLTPESVTKLDNEIWYPALDTNGNGLPDTEEMKKIGDLTITEFSNYTLTLI